MTSMRDVADTIPLTRKTRSTKPRLLTAQQIAAAACPQSPTERHRWDVDSTIRQVHRCKDCHEERVYRAVMTSGFITAEGEPKGPHLKPESRTMRDAISALEVGETCDANHHHLICEGHTQKCGLYHNLKAMRLRDTSDRIWVYEHTALHVATVTRVQ
jgi:hypothetical protein